MLYSEPVFRPPAEAYSTIIQICEGCSYNRCKFCAMYKTKVYRERSFEEIKDHIDDLLSYDDTSSKRVFLADGDALNIKTEKLIKIIDYIKTKMPNAKRFGVYGSVFSLKTKTVEELIELKKHGLHFVYLGLESGDEDVLRKMGKNVSVAEMVEHCKKVTDAKIKLSVTLIIGLGGISGSMKHIKQSAMLVNEIEPNYTSVLNIMLDHTKLSEEEEYSNFKMNHYLDEVREFIKNLNCKTIFRSNHASNYLPLEGTFPKDKEKLLGILESI